VLLFLAIEALIAPPLPTLHDRLEPHLLPNRVLLLHVRVVKHFSDHVWVECVPDAHFEEGLLDVSPLLFERVEGFQALLLDDFLFSALFEDLLLDFIRGFLDHFLAKLVLAHSSYTLIFSVLVSEPNDLLSDLIFVLLCFLKLLQLFLHLFLPLNYLIDPFLFLLL
jgi:hypothetical protein